MQKINQFCLLLLLLVGCSQQGITSPSIVEPAIIEESLPSETSDGDMSADSQPEAVEVNQEEIATNEIIVSETVLEAPISETVSPATAGTTSHYYGSQFTNTQFINNAESPALDSTTMLLTREFPYGRGVEFDKAREIADKLGFTEPLLQENMGGSYFPSGNAGGYQALMSFQGNKRLIIHEGGFTMDSMSNQNQFMERDFSADSPLPFDSLAPKITSLLTEANLMPDAYEIKRGWGNEIQILQLVDGIPLQQPIAFANFDNDGTLLFLNYTYLDLPTLFEERNIISTEAAFELLIQKPERFNVEYSDEQMMANTPHFIPQHWQNTPVDGQETTMQLYITSYQPVKGEGDSVYFGNNYKLITSNDMLKELPPSAQIIVTGIPNSSDNTFTVNSWKKVDQYNMPFVEGEIERSNDGIWVNTYQGTRLRILDAPEDLPADIRVGIEVWSIEDESIQWGTIFEQPDDFTEPNFPNQTAINTVTFSEIGLSYAHFFYDLSIISTHQSGPESEMFSLHYAFKGTTDSGSEIIFHVPAVEIDPDSDFMSDEPGSGPHTAHSLFQDTTFTNNVSFPSIGDTASRFRGPPIHYNEPMPSPIDPEWARDIANRLGFTGPFYADNPVENNVEQVNVYVLRGDQILTISSSIIRISKISDRDTHMPTINGSRSLDHLIPKAEMILGEAGLLPEQYTTEQNWGNLIVFLPVLNGISSTMQFASVTFDDNDDLLSLDYFPQELPSVIDEVSVLSAQKAYDILQKEPEIYMADFNPHGTVDASIQYWKKELNEGEKIQVVAQIREFYPNDGGFPIVYADSYQLVADEATLEAIMRNYQAEISGTLSKNEDGGLSIEVEDYQSVNNTNQTNLGGKIERTDDGVWLNSYDNRTLRILSAPDGLETGMEVDIKIESIENDELVWSEIFSFNSMQFGDSGMPIISSVTIDEIKPIYSFPVVHSPSTPMPDGPELILSLHWQFKGVTQSGASLSFNVPGVIVPISRE